MSVSKERDLRGRFEAFVSYGYSACGLDAPSFELDNGIYVVNNVERMWREYRRERGHE